MKQSKKYHTKDKSKHGYKRDSAYRRVTHDWLFGSDRSHVKNLLKDVANSLNPLEVADKIESKLSSIQARILKLRHGKLEKQNR